MKTMTLTAKSYADLRPFEMLAKKIGILVEILEEKPIKQNSALSVVNNFEKICENRQRYARRTGLTPDDIAVAIKDVRREAKVKLNACSN